jgi:uncharacterized protein (TIGR03000 family)
MSYRVLPLSLGALALALFIGAGAKADDPADKADTHEGKVVSVTENKLVMTGQDGKEHSHAVTASAAVTCDGKACKLEELKADQKIRVSTKKDKDNQDVVTKIEALAKNENFDIRADQTGARDDKPQSIADKADAHEGKFVSVTGNELAMTAKDGKKHTHTLASDAEFMCDGKACKAGDLKAGMAIKVTTRANDPDAVIKVEALQDGNQVFQDGIENKDQPRKDAPRDRTERKDQGRINEQGPQDRIETKDQGRIEVPSDRTERKDQGRINEQGPGDRTEGYYQGRNGDPSNRRDNRYQTRQENQDKAKIAVNLPEGEKLTFDDAATVSTGSDRLFITPALERGRDFHYTLEAKLTRDGKTETTSQQITVRAGERTRVNLRFAAEVRYGRLAADGDTAEGVSQEGKIIRMTADQLTMGDKAGQNEHAHTITRDTKITLDGKDSKLEDLKPGMEIRVTTKEGDKAIASRIEAKLAK